MSSASCVICAKDLMGKGEIKVTTCGHKFHSNCFNFCFNSSKTCPKCDQSLTQADINILVPERSEGRERSPQKNDDNADAFLNVQKQILEALRKLNLDSRRPKHRRRQSYSDSDDDDVAPRRPMHRRRRSYSDSDDDDVSSRRRSSCAVAERDADIVNKSGQVVRCESFKPFKLNFGLKLPF